MVKLPAQVSTPSSQTPGGASERTPRIRQCICSFARSQPRDTRPSAERSAASGIGEDSGRGFGWWGTTSRLPTPHLRMNELTSFPSLPPQRDRENRTSRLQFVRSQQRSQPLSLVTKHKPSFENARGMKQLITGLRVSSGCTSHWIAAVGGHPRRSTDQGLSRRTLAASGHRYRRGQSGVSDRTKGGE